MAYKKTVAIIGAATPVGSLIAKSIVANYRLLLMDTTQPHLVLLQAELQSINKSAEVDILPCCKNASWEADIIVVANDGEDLDELAVKMSEVSNCKTVLHFTSHQDDKNKLQQLLPHAKVVSILSSPPFTRADAFIHGTDKEAKETANAIVAAVACKSPNSIKGT